MTFWFQPFLGVFIGASAVAVTDLNINNSFRKANHFLCSISSLSVQTLHIEWVSSGKSNTREKSLALHHRLIKRVSVKSPAVLAPRVCACAHGWVHRCDADVQQEPSSWLRVRRSAAGQACDCSGLPPHPCVNTHVSGWPQKLLSLYLFISCALAEGNRCEVSMRCVALGLALNAACTIGTVELSGEPGLQPRGRPQPKLKPRNTGPIVFHAVSHILASVRDVSMTFSLYTNKTQHKNHFFRLQFGQILFHRSDRHSNIRMRSNIPMNRAKISRALLYNIEQCVLHCQQQKTMGQRLWVKSWLRQRGVLMLQSIKVHNI